MFCNIKASIVILIINIANSQRPNVCRRFIDYYTMNPKNCWYNPEIYKNTPAIIKHQGYPLETYETATEDGYLLTVYRIPKENPKGIIYLQHPAISSSICWIDKGKQDSLGFMLWDNGYDVWLGNFRGTYYSRKHKYLDPNQPQYWNFSFHEHGIYDIPAHIDLIAKETNAKPGSITFIGHSMGGTAGIIYATQKVEHSKKWLKVLIPMGASVNMIHMSKILRIISPHIDGLMTLGMQLNLAEMTAYNSFIRSLLWICRNAPTMVLCLSIETGIMEDDLEEQSPQYYPLKFSHNPGGLALKTLIHYGQIVKNGGNFTFFDYGTEKNLEYYHTKTPPIYPVENIAVPLYTIVADHDKQGSPEDTAVFYSHLSEIGKKYGILLVRNFSHVVFMYGYNTREKVHIPLLNFLDNIYEEDGNN